MEANLVVYQLPDGSTVVAGITLYVAVDVKVLPHVIVFVLHVPHPPTFLPSLDAPKIHSLCMRAHSVGIGPRLRDVSVIAATDGAAVGLADAVEDAEWAFLVDIQSDHSEVLGLDELL